MAPAVPFALLGVVQLTSVATWLGLAGAVAFPRLRRRTTPLVVAGALAMAVADAVTAVRYGPASSDPVGWLRVAGLVLLAVGAADGAGQSLAITAPVVPVAGVVVPLGARPTPALLGGAAGVVGAASAWWRGARPGADRWLGTLLAATLLLAGTAAALADPARHGLDAALALLAARAAAAVALTAALVLLARLLLVGKIVGAILAGVVAMAVAAVGVVGTAVASEVQSQQSQRLLQVATSERDGLATVASRSALFAQVIARCPTKAQLPGCESFLSLFSDQPDYFAVLVRRGKGALVVAPDKKALTGAALVQLSGSAIVQAALATGASPSAAPNGPMLLPDPSGREQLVVVTAVPVRPPGSESDARVRPTSAAVYGVVIGHDYLSSEQRTPGYDDTVLADGRVLASSLDAGGQRAIRAEAAAARVGQADPAVQRVVAAEADRPTVALVPVTDNRDVRVATLAVSQPANEALRAQTGVLRRLFLTALIALIVVALLAIALAQRIARPVRRLTVAAGRVRRGDLEATTPISSRDEVGRLARAFDAMTASLRGLTEDLRATAAQESALRARLETVVASMSDGLVVTDAAGRVTSLNPTAAALLDEEPDAVVGKRLDDVVRLEDAEGGRIARWVSRGSVEGDLVCSTGSRAPVRAGVAPLGDGQGLVVVLSDRRREHEVERMKTEFLATISHELRTPLTPIRGYAELLARRPDLSREQVESFLDEILSSTGRMSRAVELLVDVAALEGGRVEPQRHRVTVRSFVDDRVESWKQRYPERADDFKRRVSAKLPAVDIDRHWAARALDEFADNAVKYTPAGTSITLVAAAGDDPGTVRVSVRDAGPGFDPQRAAELVGDFSQADSSETRRVGGLGLGLGFASRVADRFGLPLVVATQPGKGSEFGLVLPAADD